MEVYVDVLVVVLDDGVGGDEGVAVAPGIHFFDEQSLVLFVFVLEEFLAGEPLLDARAVVGFLHGLLERFDFLFVYACDVDFMYAYFAVFPYVDVNHHAVVSGDVFALYKFHLSVFVALLVVVFGDAVACTVNEVLCHLVAHLEGYACLDVLAFRLFDAVDVER